MPPCLINTFERSEEENVRTITGAYAIPAVIALLVTAQWTKADETVDVDIHEVSAEGTGSAIGTITVKEHQYGVLLIPDLKGLSPGLHGFHLHEKPDCRPASQDGAQVAAAAAGGHYDPDKTEAHRGPFETDGHLGDLPALFFNQQGEASQPELAPNLEFADFAGRSLVIHHGGDSYSDTPEPLGGGGERVACGVVQVE